ncbi:MAG TPA: hypothetical protein VKA63_07250, partial [Candidatus Krumholzibacteria bacterium]|nr:hypothetical protein [Candidatus Krumholzibacteria bacterium]
SWRYHQQKGQKTTLQLARSWAMEELLPENPALAQEAYTPQLPTDPGLQFRKRAFFERLSDVQRARLLDRPVFRADSIPMNSVRVELSAYYYDLRHFLPYDYIVTSSSVRGRYEADPQRFPRQVEFYKELENYTQMVKSFAPEGRRKGPTIRFYHFSAQDKARLVADKGPFDPQDYREFLDRLHAPQFYAFASAVAQRALEAKMWGLAAGELDVLLEVSQSVGITQERRLHLIERASYAYYEAGAYEKSLARSMLYLRDDPNSAQVLGYQGKALEKLGAFQDALKSYQQCAQVAASQSGQGEWVAWAQARIAELQARFKGK